MGSAAIPIQSPQIRPDVVSGGQNTGLEPLIQALQFYKKSKLDEQRNQIDAVRAGSDANLQGAQADALRASMARNQAEDEAWDKQIAGAPSALQPFLRAVSASRVLPPELQHVVGAALAQAMIPGVKPEQMTQLMGLIRLGLPVSGAATLAQIKVYDIADKNNPLHDDPEAIGLDKNTLKFKFTPPSTEAREQSLRLRAQNEVVAHADRDNAAIARDVKAQQQRIAEQAWATTNPGQVSPVPIRYQPDDPNQARALRTYMMQKHYFERLNLNTTNRRAAEAQINATAEGLGVQSPEGATLAQTMAAATRILQQKDDSARAAQAAADTTGH